MKRFFFILIAILSAKLSPAQDIHPLNGDSPLELKLLQVFPILEQVTGIQCNLYSTNGDTRAIPGRGIALNLTRIQQLYNSQNKSTQEGFLLLILGHELTHIRQYMTIPSLNIAQLSNDQKRVLEAQADLLSTKYVFNYYARFVTNEMDQLLTTNTPITSKLASIQHEAEVTKQAIDLFYALGEANFNNSDHPTQLERLSAVSAGLTAGLADIINYFIVKYQNLSQAEKDRWEYWKFYAAINLLVPILYMDSGEKGEFNWSMSLAKTIVGYNREAAGNIVIMSKETHRHFTSVPENITFDYRLKNIGTKAIKAAVEFRIDSVTDDPKGVKLEAAKFLTKTIQPNETAIFADTLFFALPVGTFSTTKLRFGALSDPKAKFSFQFLDDSPENVTGFLNQNYGLGLESHTLESFLSYLEYLRSNLIRLNYTKLIAGPGRYVNSSGYQRYDFPVIVLADSLIDASLDQTFDGSKKDQLTLRIMTSKSYQTASAVYSQIVGTMKSAYSESYVISEDKDTESNTTWFKSINPKCTMMVSFDFRNPQSDSSLSYTNDVRITIFNH